MNALISTRARRIAWAFLVFILAVGMAIWLIRNADAATTQTLTDGELMTRLLVLPALLATAVLALTSACAVAPVVASANAAPAPAVAEPPKPFMAQVVGLQWLNPLQRRDYPTEWQLLWTLGLVQPNKNDDMVKASPKKYSTLQSIGSIAVGNNGEETFKGYHHKYVSEITLFFRQNYFSNPNYFYTVRPDDTKHWRELAGIHIEYALPAGKLDPVEAAAYLVKEMKSTYDIGNVHFPSLWTRATPPDVRVTMGGPNAGFTSLSAALDYLQAHPKESVWAMNWDAPSRPKDKQINENMVLLILAGPNFNTEREPLAWVGYPASKPVSGFEARKGQPPRIVQAWKATLDAAAQNASKQDTDIGYVIHDANNTHPLSSDRIGHLAQTLTTELPEFDFMKQTFNTPALLGEMGAGTALTNVALGIAYANHLGKNVLVAGTSDAEHPTAVMVVPPAKVRPIDPAQDWFRARGENNAFLPWWGLRHDARPGSQGYSQ
ncbi:MAG: virulence factor [Burkholderiales bacterium]|nr:virulence factor [Burkholderiales bacterium]